MAYTREDTDVRPPAKKKKTNTPPPPAPKKVVVKSAAQNAAEALAEKLSKEAKALKAKTPSVNVPPVVPDYMQQITDKQSTDTGVSTTHIDTTGAETGGAGRSFAPSLSPPRTTEQQFPDSSLVYKSKMVDYTQPTPNYLRGKADEITLDEIQKQKLIDDARAAAGITTDEILGQQANSYNGTMPVGGTPSQVSGKGTKINATVPGGTAPTGTGTSTGGTGTATKTDPTTSNDYITQLKNMTFEYTPATDPEYRESAATLENDVAQMMVGRGGLYSSVAQGALQSRLITLQSTFRKQAYDQYLQDRNFTFQLAQYTAGREDAAFTKKMQIATFNQNAQAQAFSQQMQREQLRISQANASYNRQLASASRQQANSKTNANMLAITYQADKSKYDKIYGDWKKTGNVSQEMMTYFKLGNVFSGADLTKAIASKSVYLNEMHDSVTKYALQIKDQDLYLASLNDFQKQSTDTYAVPTTINAPTANLGTAQNQQAYYRVKSDLNGQNANDAYNYLVKNSTTLIQEMNPYIYEKLVDEFSSLVTPAD